MILLIAIATITICWMVYITAANAALKGLIRRSDKELQDWRECAITFSIDPNSGLEKLKKLLKNPKI